ncbi:MAG: GNAT family N-acetyltransferase [Gammaproteobacteria bacterium]|nr:GNAT family N-acetyltransferase [Gammaproteobacteria bacterium]
MSTDKSFYGEWAAQRIASESIDYCITDYWPIPFMIDNKIAAVVIYSHFQKPDVTVHVASDNPHWATPGRVKKAFGYPFTQGYKRITAFIEKRNKRARKFAEGIGFVYEGNKRNARENDDLIMYGMTLKDWRAKWDS